MHKTELSTTQSASATKDDNAKRSAPALTVICHPDLSRIGDFLFLDSLAKGRSVEISRATPDFSPPGRALGAPLADAFLSRQPFVLHAAANGGVRLNRAGCRVSIKAGGQWVEETAVFASEDLSRGVAITLAKRVILLLHCTEDEKPSPEDHGLTGHSESMHFLRREIEKVADLPVPVLLRGPSGSGKELVARAIHNAGDRRRPFVAVNMGAIPDQLAASELFGAIKGSFTGADRHQLGFFRAAEGGTLFLDEIGEASPEVQVMLLRALESGEITPVGAQRAFRVKTRLIAATDADLEAKMAEDSFKAPLFHRLAGYEISLPPLTERLEDFGRLFMHFARKELALLGHRELPHSENPWLPATLVERLLAFHWPGNVRQLANVVRQLAIGCRDRPALSLTPKVAELLTRDRAADSQAERKPGGRKPADIPPDELKATLRANGWALKATAAALSISRGALYQLIERTPGLQKAGDLSAGRIRSALAQAGDDEEAAAAALEVSTRALRRRMSQLRRRDGEA